MTMLRPDELAINSQVESNQRFNEKAKGLGKAALSASSGLAGGGLAAKVAPFLSEFIPQELALKGINKVAPQIGQFLNRGVEQGLDLNEGFNYLKENLFKSEEAQQTKDDRNIIEKYSPNLFQYIKELIGNGSSPAEAAMKATKFLTSEKEKKNIQQMEKDLKTDFASIVESVFGRGTVQPQSLSPMSMQDAGDPRQMMQQKQPQQGGGDEALMAALQKVLSM